jgi:pyruvate/2-oxoglutarate dehydrogenase complex dihydrolipoamide acyltransferase (E2) component
MAEDRGEGSRRSPTERADELLNRAGWVAGMVGSMVGMHLARIAAFAREEAEDLWAEAQSMRRQNGGDVGAAGSGSPNAVRERVEETSEEPESPQETGTRTRGPIIVDATNAIRQGSAGHNAEAKTIDATPAARRHAKETGTDLQGIKGTGPGGRITVADVRKKIEAES